MSLTPEEGEKELVYTPTVEAAELTVEEEMQQALARVSLTNQKIAEMVELAATITQVTTFEEAEHADKVRAEVANWRILGMKNVSRIHKRFVDMWKLSNRVSKELEARLSEPELLIDAKLVPWRQEQERKRKEEEELIAAEKERRQKRLLELRCTFVPGPPEHRYVCGTGGWSAREVMEADHQTWLNMEREALLVCEELERKEAEEREKKEAEERERLRREKELADKEEQLAKERYDMIMERGQMRIEKLENALGAKRGEDGIIRVDGQPAVPYLDIHAVGSLPAEEWDEFSGRCKHYANSLTEAKQKAEKDAATQDARKAELMAMGCELWGAHQANGQKLAACLQVSSSSKNYYRVRVDQLHTFDDDGWADEILAVKLAQEQFNLDQQERLAGLKREAIIHERSRILKEAGYVEHSAHALRLDHPGGKTVLEHDVIADEKDYVFNEWVDRGGMELARRKKAEEDRIAADAARKALEQAEEQRAQAAEAEKRRQAQLGDVERWHEWVATVKASAPKMDSEIGNHAISRVIAGLDKMTPSLIEDLKK